MIYKLIKKKKKKFIPTLRERIMKDNEQPKVGVKYVHTVHYNIILCVRNSL